MSETNKNMIALLVGVLVIFIAFNFANFDTEYEEENYEEEKVNFVDLIEWDEVSSLGDENAPVRMVNFSTHYCPFCHDIENDVFPRLKEEYIDTGKLAYLYKGIGDPEDISFQAPYCAGREDLYWEYHSRLYSDRGLFDINHLTSIAVELGINQDNFVSCLEQMDYKDILLNTQNELEEVNFRGTPHIIIEDVVVSGARPYDYYKQIIEQKLNENN